MNYFKIPAFVLLAAAFGFELIQCQENECPSRCLCFRTTVRCMFLQMEKVPEVPSTTTILDLRFNKIKEVPKNAFVNLKKLNTLLLNNNHIIKVDDNAFNGLKELRYLYLYKNKIRTIGSQAFKGLHKLEQLYIHFNKIEEIEPDTFSDLPALERLFLHNNKLSRIPYGAFKKLGALRRLRLDSNALTCNCELMWLAQMLKENQATTQAAVTCEHPAPLQGKSLTTLSSVDLRCKKPELTEEPSDVDISFGGTAYFNCKADGDPKPDIVWLHNNNEILPDEGGRYSVLTDGTLMITDTQDLDEGVYECMAKNPVGEVKSRAAKMHYYLENKAKMTFVEFPTNHNISVGSTINLPCRAAGDPVPTITWTHNGLPLPPSHRYYVSSKGTLSIKNVQRLDSGIYECSATNLRSNISIAAQINVQALPTFLERPRDQEALEGHDVELTCIVDGFPPPEVYWTKDGRVLASQGRISILNSGTILNIREVQELDEGYYLCHGVNSLGQRNTSVLLVIRENVPPVFSRIPEDQTVALHSTVELPCHAKGQPIPAIKWRRNGSLLENSGQHHRISPHGDLYIFNAEKSDEGLYECGAENSVGFASVHVSLTVEEIPSASRPGDRFVGAALEEARLEVDRALNHTVSQLFGNPHVRSPGELLQVFRFPTDDARSLARAAEIYERALEIVWSHVQSNAYFNLTDFSYEDILSPRHLDLLANLSGCLIHRHIPKCSDMCFHRKYRTLDGSCNNFNHPRWGSSLTPFVRLLPAIYENGFNIPIGWSRTKLYNGYPLPSARLVSTHIVSTDSVSSDYEFSHMLMQWGQFLDHDLDFSMPAISHESFVEGVNCATSCEYASPCFPIDVPPGDRRIHRLRCMEFTRSSSLCGSGLTSLFFNKISPREQVNQLTSFIDASNVYGSNDQIGRHLRNLTTQRGLLRAGRFMHTGKRLLPFNDGQPIDCKRDLRQSSVDCFLAGDVRANEQLGLLAMHTLWMREHNRIATELFTYNPHWSGDKLYNEARKIVGAVMQHITYTHWLPKVLGPRGFSLLGPYLGYDPTVNPSILNAFATAALRFGHTLINPELLRLNGSFQPIPQGNIPLRNAFFAPFRLLEEGGIDPLMRGLFYAPAKLRTPDQLLNSDLTEHLFTPAHLVAQDLAALNIQRSRDHGIPSYNHWRKLCNLSTADSFDDLRNEIKNVPLLRKIEELYSHPDNIDLWVGGISEDPIEGARVGLTFRCILIDQFRRIRSGDRFWYENPGVFTPEQLVQIKQSSLGRVMCDNGDNITQVTDDVFIIPQLQERHFVDCSSIPKVELKVWTECCEECGQSEDSNEIARLRYRNKRSFDVQNKQGPPKERNNSIISNSCQIQGLNQSNAFLCDEKHFDATEQRIEGIEDLVGKLEKTVQKLNRKLRKVESECRIRKDGCKDHKGHDRKHEEEWRQDMCTTCKCQLNQVMCWVETCAPVTCNNPQVTEGKCCSQC